MTRRPDKKKRALAILDEIQQNVSNSALSLLKVGSLLSEFKNKHLFTLFNFSNMPDWIRYSDIGITADHARALMTIVERAGKLSLPLADLAPLGMTRLGMIFELNPKIQGDQMLELLKVAQSMTPEEIKAEVRKIQAKTDLTERVSTDFLRYAVAHEVFLRIKEIEQETGLPMYACVRLQILEAETDNRRFRSDASKLLSGAVGHRT